VRSGSSRRPSAAAERGLTRFTRIVR
jgi:hypothetical protein